MAVALIFSILVIYSFVLVCSADVEPRVINVSRCFGLDTFVDTFPGSGGNCTELDTALDQLSSDVTIVLEHGTHLMNRSHHMDIRGASNIKIIGAGADATVITCADQNGLSFVGVTDLVLVNFTITGCGLNGSNMVYHISLLSEVLDLWFMIPPATKIALFLGHCTNVIIQDVNITRTAGLGFLGINILGTSTIKRLGFTNNICPKCLNKSPPIAPSLIDPDSYNQVGGGAFFLYTDILNSSNIESAVNLLMSELYFGYNADCTFAANTIMNFPFFTDMKTKRALYNYTIGAGGGLSVILSNRYFVVSVNVNDSIFYQNAARHGSGAFVAAFAGFQKRLTVTFHGCTFAENGLTASYHSKYYNKTHTHCNGGAGLAIFTDLLRPNDFQNEIPTSGVKFLLGIYTTVFVNNAAQVQGGGIFAYSLMKTQHQVSNINDVKKFYIIHWYFANITFTNNSALYGSAGFFDQMADFSFGGSVLLYLTHITARKNHHQVTSSNNLDYLDTSTLHIKKIVGAFGDVTLENNAGSALRLDSTIISIQDGARVIFQGNTAHRGGALYLSGHSPALILHNNSLLHFEENTASIEGGAVYYSLPDISDEISQSYNLRGCFLLTPSFSSNQNSEHFGIFDLGITIFFKKNHAPIGGTIFGSSLQSCSWAKKLMSASIENLSLYSELYRDYNSTFFFDYDPVDGSISTPPTSIIVKTAKEEPLQAYPGQALPIEIKVLDFYNNTIPAIVTSAINTVNRTRTKSTLSESGFWYTDIANTTLSVASLQTGLVSVSIFTSTSSVSTTVSVNLSSCPIGFEQNQHNLRCICSELFLPHHTSVTCDINNISFEVLETFWVGVDPTILEPTSKDLILSRCVFNYCIIGNKTVLPAQIDSQCDHHRTGILCGSCNREKGYSSVFGSYECHKCSNYMLFLIIVFAIAGAVLFSGIFFLEITIDKGWTNSIIFFCSVVAIYEYLILEPRYNIGFLPAHLLNLQIGVSLCFYDGMTSLSRTGLQLVFPLYLYVLMAVFTILCRRYSWMSTHFSPAKTLMTLSVMCYTSVLTTCVELLGVVRINTFGGMNTSYRWYNDPNQVYFQDLHAFLCLISIAIVLIYIIPFPILLLFPNLAYKHLVRFTPLFDALWAAYKPKYRFWLGIRLMSVAFFFISTRLPTGYGITFGGIYAVVFFQLQGALLPFKDKVANYSEIFFLTIVLLSYWNSLCLIAFTITYRVKIIASISVGVLTILPYLVMLILFFLHLHRQFPCLWQKFRCLVLNYIKNLCCKRGKPSHMANVVELEANGRSQSAASHSGGVHFTSVHMHYPSFPASLLHESNLHFRESLLGSV